VLRLYVHCLRCSAEVLFFFFFSIIPKLID
jgi:hypothetical protein